MKTLLALIVLISLIVTGCSNVRTYTFKKDRVDQRVEGNRGYLSGSPPPAPVEREASKRTLIGVDIEVPILPGEKGYEPKQLDFLPWKEEQRRAKEAEDAKRKREMEEKPQETESPAYKDESQPVSEPTSLEPTLPESTTTPQEVVVDEEDEDEWIK